MKKYAYGVDIGGTTVKIGFFETTGKLVDTWEIPTRTENDGELILPDIAESIKENNEKNSITTDDIEGIGMGVPGPVKDDGTVLKCVNLGWGVFNVEKALSVICGGVKVKAGNDANVAALGEMWQGGGKGYEDVVMITLGTGVGGGIIRGGKIVAGTNGAAGEMHFKMYSDKRRKCTCGSWDCFEIYASGTGLKISAQEMLNNPNVTTYDVMDGVKNNEPKMLEVYHRWENDIANGIIGLANLFDPECVVLSGSLAQFVETDKIEKIVNEEICTTPTKVVKATAGNYSGMIGAALLALQKGAN